MTLKKGEDVPINSGVSFPVIYKKKTILVICSLKHKSCKVHIAQSNTISEVLKRRVIEDHKTGNGFHHSINWKTANKQKKINTVAVLYIGLSCLHRGEDQATVAFVYMKIK